jgi:hypothetical protein
VNLQHLFLGQLTLEVVAPPVMSWLHASPSRPTSS